MIDFSDVTSMYGDVYASAANQAANKLKDRLGNIDATTEDELLSACQQFEAYFIEQIYKGMMKTVPQSESTSNYTSMVTDFYKDQMMQSMAEQTTKQNGGVGLAQMLYEQMKRNYGIGVVTPGQLREEETVDEENAETEAVQPAAAI